jgi:hypothetical protein
LWFTSPAVTRQGASAGLRRMVINPLSLFECVLPARGWADPSACQPLVSERPIPPVPSGESLCVVFTLRPSLLVPVPPCLRPPSLVVASPHEGRGKGTCLPPTVVVPMSPPTGATTLANTLSTGPQPPGAPPPWHVRRLPPPRAPRALRLCLMPHMPYLPLRHRAILHFFRRWANRHFLHRLA